MDDLISREAAIDAFKKELTVGESKGNYVTICSAVGYIGAKQILESLPSAPPQRMRGRWIPHSEKCREYIGTVLINVEYDYWLCDTCGYRVERGQPMYNFCPNCGADMRETEWMI